MVLLCTIGISLMAVASICVLSAAKLVYNVALERWALLREIGLCSEKTDDCSSGWPTMRMLRFDLGLGLLKNLILSQILS